MIIYLYGNILYEIYSGLWIGHFIHKIGEMRQEEVEEAMSNVRMKRKVKRKREKNGSSVKNKKKMMMTELLAHCVSIILKFIYCFLVNFICVLNNLHFYVYY